MLLGDVRILGGVSTSPGGGVKLGPNYTLHHSTQHLHCHKDASLTPQVTLRPCGPCGGCWCNIPLHRILCTPLNRAVYICRELEQKTILKPQDDVCVLSLHQKKCATRKTDSIYLIASMKTSTVSTLKSAT